MNPKTELLAANVLSAVGLLLASLAGLCCVIGVVTTLRFMLSANSHDELAPAILVMGLISSLAPMAAGIGMFSSGRRWAKRLKEQSSSEGSADSSD